MATIQQAERGLERYIESEMLPHLSAGKKLAVSIYINMAKGNLESAIEKYKNHPAVALVKVFDEKGEINLDRLYNAVEPAFANSQKQTLHIPMIGDFTFDKTDIEKLYQYIKEA